jgi:ferritin-like metal-binding protein YciE
VALNNPADLFMYELSAIYDAETKDTQMKGEIAGQIREGALAQDLRNEQTKGQQKIKNLDGCFQALGAPRQDVPCLAVDGMRAEFQQFMGQQPSPEVLEMYTVGASLKFAAFQSASYQGLVDKAMLMGQNQCAQLLQTNMVQVDESAGHFERLSHEISSKTLVGA